VNLLGAILYDPAVSVNKVTTAALAMTAIDTVNLRLAITVPAHGKVRFRLMAVIHGATTFPSILMGVMVGASVKGRVAPVQSLGNTAVATALVNVEADFIATGLAPGATNFDAAYGVETLVAATGLKYGGADNNTANDAFGGFVFEAWDPQPMTANSTLAVDASGRVDVSKVSGTVQTARDLGGQLDAAITTRAAAATAVSNADYTVARAAKLDNLDATVSSRSTYAGGDTAGTTTLLGRLTAPRALLLDNLDATVSSRFATASYTAPDNASVAAIKAKTDSLNFTVPGKLDASIYYVNGVAISGLGTDSSPWKGP
jgi:hypothetical protein